MSASLYSAARLIAFPRRPMASLLRNSVLLLALMVIATVLLWSLFPEAFATHSPTQAFPARRLIPPGSEAFFGTDSLGRDLYARMVHGAGVSMLGALLAVTISVGVGCGIGMAAGYVGGSVDSLLMRVVDILLAVPSLLLALMVVTILGPGTGNAAIAVGIGGVGHFARLVRTEVLRCRSAAFIEAARLAGSSHWYILRAHVLPNVSGTLIALGVLEFCHAILSLAGLSFLGYGAAPPTPEWGSLVADGRNYLLLAWWMTALPGAVIVALVLALNYVSKRIHAAATIGG